MRPTHLSRLRVPAGRLEDLALLHAEWVLGLGRFSSLRERRLEAGVDPSLDAAAIAGDRLKLALPEADGSKRISVVRVGPVDGGVLVEHLVLREVSDPAQRRATASAPEVVLHLLGLPGVLAEHDPADGRALDVDVPEVRALVERILAPTRTLPIVLVSVDNALRKPLLEPAELAHRLAGMASVFFLDTVAASRELKNELLARGFSEKFGCYNGGVRILWPGIGAGDDPYDHLLLLPARLWNVPERRRAEHVAGVFCEMIAEDEDVRAWLREVEPPRSAPPPRPRAVAPASLPTVGLRARLTEVAGPIEAAVSSVTTAPPVTRPAVSAPEPPPAPPIVGAPEPPARVAEPAPAVPVLAPPTPEEPAPPSAEPAPPQPAEPTPTPTERADESSEAAPPARPDTHWSRVANDVVAALDLAAELEAELEATRRELGQTKKALRRAEQERDEAQDSLGKIQSVAAALARAEGLFPERLVVLDSAHDSAEDSPYKHPTKVFEVLAVLALYGREDRELDRALAAALGGVAEWRPKDSPETTTKFGGERTFVASDGAPKLFRRHITIGGSKNATRCLQIYYDVLADGRLEIGWCGEHRPTVGMDT